MAELNPNERLQPSLFDRLIDENPQDQKPKVYRGMSQTELKNAVLRDLESLLNCTNLASADPSVEDYPEAANSVINYGIPCFTGQPASTVNPNHVAKAIKKAIVDFEPRILADSLQVSAVEKDKSQSNNTLVYHIQGILWGQPLPLELYLRTELNLESGDIEVTHEKAP